MGRNKFSSDKDDWKKLTNGTIALNVLHTKKRKNIS